MPLLPLLLLAASAAAPASSTAIALDDRHIRAGDIAAAGEHGEKVIGRLPRGAERIELDEGQARALLRKAFPAHNFALRFQGKAVLTTAAPDVAPNQGCFRAAEPIMAGEAITLALVETAPCEKIASKRALGFDRARMAPVARAPIAPGDYLGAVRPARIETIGEGRKLVFRTGEGPITVEREVITLQPARSGQRVFARTADGEVIAARLEPEVNSKHEEDAR